MTVTTQLCSFLHVVNNNTHAVLINVFAKLAAVQNVQNQLAHCGREGGDGLFPSPSFLVVCPMLIEDRSVNLAPFLRTDLEGQSVGISWRLGAYPGVHTKVPRALFGSTRSFEASGMEGS